MFKMRKMQQQDKHAIIVLQNNEENIHLQNSVEVMDDTQLTMMMEDEKRRILVVEQAGELIGFLVVQLLDGITIEKFTIHHAYHRKGLDHHLYQKVKRLADKNQIHQLRATITSPEMIAFFELNHWTGENGVYHIELG